MCYYFERILFHAFSNLYCAPIVKMISYYSPRSLLKKINMEWTIDHVDFTLLSGWREVRRVSRLRVFELYRIKQYVLRHLCSMKSTVLSKYPDIGRQG